MERRRGNEEQEGKTQCLKCLKYTLWQYSDVNICMAFIESVTIRASMCLWNAAEILMLGAPSLPYYSCAIFQVTMASQMIAN